MLLYTERNLTHSCLSSFSVYHLFQNLLICAPTGAGKTNVAMLTIVAHFRDKGILGNKIDFGHHNSGFEQGKKVIYIAPMKALAQEVVEKFDSKLRSLRIVSASKKNVHFEKKIIF
jgi:replicative superfamily II helicase